MLATARTTRAWDPRRAIAAGTRRRWRGSGPVWRAAVAETSANLTGSQRALQENQIEPAVELVAHGAQAPGAREAEALVEADGSGIVRVHARDHDVLTEGARARDERAQQLRADAATASVGAHVERMLDGEAVAGPGAKVTEAAERRDPLRVAHDEHRVAPGGARLPPAPPLLHRDRQVGEHRRRVRDHLVVDFDHALEVGFGGIVHRSTCRRACDVHRPAGRPGPHAAARSDSRRNCTSGALVL